MEIKSLEENIINMLEVALKKEYLYHSAEHTEMVYRSARLLSEMEGLTEQNSLIVQTAGLMHDCGFLSVYKGHEEESANMSRQLLPSFGYDDEQIELVCRLILATKMPQKPNDLLEMIICDADMFYLGEASYFERSGLLRKEMKYMGMEYSDKDWLSLQSRFLREHRFFTSSASSLLDKGKASNLTRVNEYLCEYA